MTPIKELQELSIALNKDIKNFNSLLNLALGEGLTKQERQDVYRAYGQLKKD